MTTSPLVSPFIAAAFNTSAKWRQVRSRARSARDQPCSRRVVVEVNLFGADDLAIAIMPACAADMVRQAKLAAIRAFGAAGRHERIVGTPHPALGSRLAVLLDSHDLTFRRPALFWRVRAEAQPAPVSRDRPPFLRTCMERMAENNVFRQQSKAYLARAALRPRFLVFLVELFSQNGQFRKRFQLFA